MAELESPRADLDGMETTGRHGKNTSLGVSQTRVGIPTLVTLIRWEALGKSLNLSKPPSLIYKGEDDTSPWSCYKY